MTATDMLDAGTLPREVPGRAAPTGPPVPTPLAQLRRLRWAVRATLILGVAASVAANILHAQPHPVSQTISAWPPLALLITVELIARMPARARRGLAAIRLAAAAVIAAIAAYVSYWHMVDVAIRYGETGASPHLIPLSVDGLIVVASAYLVELSARIRTLEGTPATPAPAPPVPSTVDEIGFGTLPEAPVSPAPVGQRTGKGDRWAAICELRAAKPGITQSEVAARLGCSERAVRYAIPEGVTW